MSEVRKLLKQQSQKAADTLAQIDLAIEKMGAARVEVAEARRLVINQLLEGSDDEKPDNDETAQQAVA